MKTCKQLGLSIRNERKRLGVTQADLAMTAGVGLRFLSELENGKESVHLGKMLHVTEALGLSFQLHSLGNEQ